jgi:hypothetical protein
MAEKVDKIAESLLALANATVLDAASMGSATRLLLQEAEIFNLFGKLAFIKCLGNQESEKLQSLSSYVKSIWVACGNFALWFPTAMAREAKVDFLATEAVLFFQEILASSDSKGDKVRQV